ncbi:MAG: lamin tail domain-containing protein, partial [Verrucomicrobia bacterium]|nr:lamin tail domain-containing protein [Verrucomicrobiota bacterium]
RASTRDGGTPGATEQEPAAPAIVINEVVADGGDFVELFNRSTSAIDLAGWGLSDDGANPRRFPFPAVTTLTPGGYLAVWCDSEAGEGLHSGFGLEREGESLFLSDVSGARVDALSFGMQVNGLALGRDGSLSSPTPGAANSAPVELASQSQLSINEWLANPAPGGDDWLELYNRSSTAPVALHGLLIEAGDATFRYSARSFLAPGAHLQLWADHGAGADHLDLRLPAEGGSLTLADRNGSEIETLTFGQQTENVSSGRVPDGAGTITTFPTSGSPAGSNYTHASSPIALNELLAGADGWVELKNSGSAGLQIDGFSIGIDDRFSAPKPLAVGQTLPAGGRIKLDLATFEKGGAVFLYDAAGREIDRVEFGAQPAGMSIGRASDSGAFRLLSAPTPAAANANAAPLGSSSALKINEWLSNGDGSTSDYIEIFNPGASAVLLAGLRLTDDLSQTGISQFAFPPLSYVGANGFVALTADNSRSRGHLPFSLDASGETLRLYAASGTNIIDQVTWGIESEGVSSGRVPNGGTTTRPLTFKSPGSSNELDPNADSDADGIPDWWEVTNGLNSNDQTDGALDSDGDTATNLFEYLSGTDPNNRGSLLRFDSITNTPGGFTIQFTAQAEISYTVEFGDDLADSNWTAIATIAPSPSVRTETVIDSTIGDQPERFYRIVAERPE